MSTVMLLSALSVWAQSGVVTTKITDSQSGEGIAGAVIELAPKSAPDQKGYYASESGGVVRIENISNVDYAIRVTYLGYEEYSSEFSMSKTKGKIDAIKLTPSSLQIDNVVKEVEAMRTSQKGDTLSYNAAAFKVTADSDVEGLLKKMPGVTIENGVVSAQGEEIKKIFVDGKEFFSDDVTTAIKTLPAEVVKNIEVYDKLSDEAEFSGMDDGKGQKAINIVTHENKRVGAFGKLYAGGGYEPDAVESIDEFKYLGGANVNFFEDTRRVSAIALFNNINKQDFSFEDILGISNGDGGNMRHMARPQSGIATVGALGLNYSDELADGALKIQASYFYNGTNTFNQEDTDRWYEYPVLDTMATTAISDTHNYNHRFNGRFDWRISEDQSLMVRPSISFQSNDNEKSTLGSRYGDTGYSIYDSNSNGQRDGYNAGVNAYYRYKFGDTGHMLTAGASARIVDNGNVTTSYSNKGTAYKNPDGSPVTSLDTVGVYDRYPDLVELRYLYADAPNSSSSYSGNVGYNGKITDHMQLSLNYRFNRNSQQTSKDSYVTESDFSIAGLTPDPATSNTFESIYTTNSIGPGLRFFKDKSNLVLGVNFQNALLDSYVVKGGDDDNINKSFNNVTYSAMGQVYINQENSLRLYLNSSTSNPSVTKLQNVYTLTNTQNISHGNPNLIPTYVNHGGIRYINSDIEKGRTFMVMVGGQASFDVVANHILYEPDPFVIDGETYAPLQYSTPVNLDHKVNLNTMMSYGFPVPYIMCNMNLKVGANYSLSPSKFGGEMNLDTGLIEGGEVNYTDNMGYNASAALGSNISEYVDFNLSWRGQYNEYTNSAIDESVNSYVSHTTDASLKWIMWNRLTLTGSVSYNQYFGITSDYNDEFIMCNLFLGTKLLKDRSLEVMVGVNDLLNQNTSFARSITSGYAQNMTSSVLGRYFSLQAVYNLRLFKGSMPAQSSQSKPSSGGRGPGRGPGGGGHSPMY